MLALMVASIFPLMNPLAPTRTPEWAFSAAFGDYTRGAGGMVLSGGGRWRMGRTTTLGLRLGTGFSRHAILGLEGDLALLLHRRTRDIPFDFGLVPSVGLWMGDRIVLLFPTVHGLFHWTFRLEDVRSPVRFYVGPMVGAYVYSVDTGAGRVSGGDVDGGVVAGFTMDATRALGWGVEAAFGRFGMYFTASMRIF